MTNRVWVLGDAVVDLVPDDNDRYLKCPGGAPANVAVGAAIDHVQLTVRTVAEHQSGQIAKVKAHHGLADGQHFNLGCHFRDDDGIALVLGIGLDGVQNEGLGDRFIRWRGLVLL